jgi:3-oxoacyl-[acyl-carrier-protein] synthase III
MKRCLDLNQLVVSNIDWFVFHQASRFLLETLADRMGLPRDKVPIRIADTGNTVSSTIPMVLADMIARGEHAGCTVLISGFGVGLSWATNVLFFGDAHEPG